MPIQFRREPPPQAENQVLTWVLRGLGLVAVALISGLVWWYIHDDATPAASDPGPTTAPKAGQYDFAPVADPHKDGNCAQHSYDKVKGFFQTTPCEQLTRGLYTTTTPEGRKVYTNVSVVRMASADQAAKLRELADQDNTGNVNDLVREGVIKVPPLRSLSGGGGYKAVQHDRNVIIVEADFDPSNKKKDEPTLDSICEDAIRLGDQIGATPSG